MSCPVDLGAAVVFAMPVGATVATGVTLIVAVGVGILVGTASSPQPAIEIISRTASQISTSVLLPVSPTSLDLQ